MASKCIFCEIVADRAASYTVYEDEHVRAFLDIHPVSSGHTLIVPKEHYENIYDIPEQELEHIAAAAKRLALLYRSRLGAEAANLLQSSGRTAQQEVFHFHMHLIPRYAGDGVKMFFGGSRISNAKGIEEVFAKISGNDA